MSDDSEPTAPTEAAAPADAQALADAQSADAQSADAQADLPPDRLAIHPHSPHFDQARLARGIGIRFKGVERTNVEEYCISEGWVRVQAGRTLDRRGNPLTLKLSGPVEAWYQDLGDSPPVARKD
jgi:hypothetical protein